MKKQASGDEYVNKAWTRVTPEIKNLYTSLRLVPWDTTTIRHSICNVSKLHDASRQHFTSVVNYCIRFLTAWPSGRSKLASLWKKLLKMNSWCKTQGNFIVGADQPCRTHFVPVVPELAISSWLLSSSLSPNSAAMVKYRHHCWVLHWTLILQHLATYNYSAFWTSWYHWKRNTFTSHTNKCKQHARCVHVRIHIVISNSVIMY